MTSILRKQFADSLALTLDPLLRGQGFKGRGWKWRRVREPVVDCVMLQSRREGGSCCVNLGVHLTFLPTAGTSALVGATKISEVDCEIRKRATWPGESDHWWRYDKPVRETADLVACLEDQGMKFVDQFSFFPHPFVDIEPSSLGGERADQLFPFMLEARRSLLLARVQDHLGNAAVAAEFARLGLENLGRATALRPAFQEIIEKCG